MKSLLEITLSILQDCGMQCGADPTRDSITITRRVKHEGDAFLCITLPAFGSALEKSVAEGFFSPALFSWFRRGKGTGLPRFLSGFLEKMFDSSGRLRHDFDVTAFACVRQICHTHRRILRPCVAERTSAALRRYRDIESELRVHVVPHDSQDTFKRVSRIVWSSILHRVPFGDPYDELRPRHGPGTTVEGLRGNAKYDFPSWPRRLDDLLPFTEFGISSILNPDVMEKINRVRMPSPRDETPVKVVFVPKTVKTPRVIAIEPVCMQYTQQAIADWVRERIEHLSPFTASHVLFRDQSVNARLARIGSINGSYATLDMSDASDRVSCRLVWQMLESVPNFRKYVFGTRSTRARLPDGTIIPLRKFASMGSALCFPIEACCFFIAIVSIRLQNAGVRITPRNVKRFTERVHVYGDDLIIPNDEARLVIDGLESFGFKVNSAKSFWTGKFRESCGRDYYGGIDVTPVYLRRDIPDHRADVKGILSTVSFANQLYANGLWKTCRMVRESVEKLTGSLPSISDKTQAVGWHSFSNAMSFSAWDNDYQRPKLRCLVPVPRKRFDPLSGDSALLKCLRLVGTPTDREHLFKSVRYGNLALKRRWI